MILKNVLWSIHLEPHLDPISLVALPVSYPSHLSGLLIGKDLGRRTEYTRLGYDIRGRLTNLVTRHSLINNSRPGWSE